ncbi:MAG: BrxA family protein [Ktedonobacteraceae bacterium]
MISGANNPSASNKLYTSRIIKAGALLADTKTMLANWDETLSGAENLARFRRENIFGKASRSRIEDMLAIFRQRYLITSTSVTKALVTLVQGGFPNEGLDRILYFHAAQADTLLHDIVTEVLSRFHSVGKIDVAPEDIRAGITQWIAEGRMISAWSENTLVRATRELLSTLRDFGILQGAVNKRLAPIYLPVEAFAYLAFYLQQRQPSGERLLDDPEWQLFFLSRHAVERFFLEAHQHHLLEYSAAGSIIRITFPATSIEEYAYALAQRAH